MRSEMTVGRSRLDTICFGGEDWWYHNRGHIDMQLMRRFARLGELVYVNSLVVAKPNLREASTFLKKVVRKSRSIFKGLRRSDGEFWVYSPFSLPVHHLRRLSGMNRQLLHLQLRRISRKLGLADPLVWVACPIACDSALALGPSKLVYQRTDRFEEFPNVPHDNVVACDRVLKAKADLTVFVSSTLFAQEADSCKQAILLDHGVDFDLFASAEQDPAQPADITGIPKPIVGFFGGFAEHTTDVSLLRDVVQRLPELSFVFVGKASQESEVLSSYRNVWMLGQKPYEEIPHYGKCFDVAIMPWKRNEWIKACNPIKLKEYLALGKPVVSRPYDELRHYLDVVYEAVSPAEFAAAIRRALADNGDERIAARRDKVRNASWDSKAEHVLGLLYPQEMLTQSGKADDE